ncbi:MAG: hypothetical protein HQK96_20580 [Nitrospirae bacterium]|nr:hypothetical protein [Nitrospirota bacterium]
MRHSHCCLYRESSSSAILNCRTIIAPLNSQISIGEPATYESLKLFPLFFDKSLDDGYLLLDEAIETNNFTVTEISEGGHVPELKVTNLLDEDVLIIDGDAFIGAKQNRIANTSILIGKKQNVVIPVSCVEQGRWSYRSRGSHRASLVFTLS